MSEEIAKDILKYKKSGIVLDLGCEKAPVSKILAEKGFIVDAVDISQEVLFSIKHKNINKIQADLNEFKIKERYDIILALGILHFLSKRKAIELINQIKEKTKIQGINIIDAFQTNLNKDDLKKLYTGWKILESESYIDKENNKMFYLIAQKTNSS